VPAEIDPPHLRIAAHLLRPALGQNPALVQHRDLLGDRENHLHVVFGKQQGQATLAGDAPSTAASSRAFHSPTSRRRQASFAPEQVTQVEVRFDPVGDETRVTVEHFGWDTVPQDHVARHGFPDAIFLRRHAEWWQSSLAAMATSMSMTQR
jgi:hypothetical protein